jgi:predicted RNA-binding Zn-ribbon protein involved in translation (DUF1610 family)
MSCESMEALNASILCPKPNVFGFYNHLTSVDESKDHIETTDESNEIVFVEVMKQIDDIFVCKIPDDITETEIVFEDGMEAVYKEKTFLMNCNGKDKDVVVKKSSYHRNDEAYMKKFTTMSDVEDLCKSKETCIKFLVQMGVLNSSYQCPICGNEMTMCRNTSIRSSSDGYVWSCRITMNGVRHQVHRSIRKSSWLSDCNLTLEEMIKLIYHWTQNLKQNQIMHESLTGYESAVNFGKKCRKICENICMTNSEAIGGEDVVIEIDETKVGKRKYNK